MGPAYSPKVVMAGLTCVGVSPPKITVTDAPRSGTIILIRMRVRQRQGHWSAHMMIRVRASCFDLNMSRPLSKATRSPWRLCVKESQRWPLRGWGQGPCRLEACRINPSRALHTREKSRRGKAPRISNDVKSPAVNDCLPKLIQWVGPLAFGQSIWK